MHETTVEMQIQLFTALAKAQGEVKPAIKDRGGQIGSQTYKYADLSAVAEAVGTALVDNGLAIVFSPGMFSNGVVEITATILHSSGGYLEYPYSFPVDLTYPKSGSPYYSAQNVGKVLTYARRYAKVGILDIVTEDEEGKQDTGSGGRQQQGDTQRYSTPQYSVPPVNRETGEIERPPSQPSLGTLTKAQMDGLRLTSKFPSPGILGHYLTGTMSVPTDEAIIGWSNDNPGADGMVLFRNAAENFVAKSPNGKMKDDCQKWLEANS